MDNCPTGRVLPEMDIFNMDKSADFDPIKPSNIFPVWTDYRGRNSLMSHYFCSLLSFDTLSIEMVIYIFKFNKVVSLSISDWDMSQSGLKKPDNFKKICQMSDFL